MPRLSKILLERFWEKVDRSKRCWEWTAGLFAKAGYGQFAVRQYPYHAHRLSWQIANGPIPRGLCVLHKCDNRKCVNPAHLFLGTKGDNIRDCVAKGRTRRGELNHKARLKTADVLSIRKLRVQGETLASLSKKYGVTKTQISYIANRQSWKHIGA